MKSLTIILAVCLAFGSVLTLPGESLLEEFVDNTFPTLLSKAGEIKKINQFLESFSGEFEHLFYPPHNYRHGD